MKDTLRKDSEPIFNKIIEFSNSIIYLTQCANHLYANRNLRYSKWWSSFLPCCVWRVFCVYEDLLWFCLLDSILKQHYYLRQFIWTEVVFLYFVSESPNLTRIQTHHLHIGHVTLIKYKYRQLYSTTKERKMKEKNGFAKFIAMYLSSCTCIS